MSRRTMILAGILWPLLAGVAQAQGNGPGFHAAVVFGGGCSAANNQTVSAPNAPAAAGPTTIPCISGSGSAAGEAGVSTLRASSRSEHVCCGTSTATNGRARIQIENVIITGPPAASIPVSINFRMRGTIASHPDFGQAGVYFFVALSGFNTLMQSTSAIDMNSTGFLNQSGVFAPLSLEFPEVAIDHDFVTPVVNAAPNQPLRLDFELMTYSDMAGLGATQSDFFSDDLGVRLPFGVPVFNLPPGYSINIPELNIIDNLVALPTTVDNIFIVGTNASEISSGTVTHVIGHVNIDDNGSLVSIDLSNVEEIGGNVSIDDNGSLTTLDLSSLTTVGENVTVNDNDSMTTLDLGSLQAAGEVVVDDNDSMVALDLGSLATAGVVHVSDNDSMTSLDLATLVAVDGDMTVENNGACTHVVLGPLTTVTGNLTIESCGIGVFLLGSAIVGGNTSLTTSGYAGVNGLTAAGTTAISNATADARVTVHLPQGSFVAPTAFALTRLDPQTLAPEPGLGSDGAAATIDPIAAYQITFGVPVLNANATLTFDVFLAGLDSSTATALLDAVGTGGVTLVTRQDAAGSEYQAFEVCGAAQVPLPGGCVQVQLLDAAYLPATGLPAIVRFTGVAGHFSTWGVAFVTEETSETFTFAGLLPPYPAPPHDETPAFHRGRVIPIKFGWTDASGALVDSAAAAPSISISPLSCASLAPTSEPITPDDAGQSGGLRYDVDAATWIFNWSTKPLAAGCYAIRVIAGSPAFAAPASSFALALRNK